MTARAGEIEAWGRGIERMMVACRAAGFPEFTHEETGLWVSFPFSDLYLRRIEGSGGHSEGSLAGEVSDPVNDPVADPVTMEVTMEVRLLRVMKTAMTRRGKT
ncbi:MAG: hypothetical protein ABIT01_02340 [Thermoanaerobaculia bacterium]